MTTSDLLEKVGAAIIADTTLNAWCNDQFGRSPTVFVGIDEQDPPRQEDYPVIALLGIDQVRGIGEREQTWTLSVGLGVVNEEISVSGNLRVRTGFLQVETMRELVEDAIYRARILPARTSGEAAAVYEHPLYVSYTAISFKALRPAVMG